MANGEECCELCPRTATMFCESDQARLCWDCDGKVHAANFLVAKHTRTLLCHLCHCQTPWKAAGPKLGPTISVCDGCARQRSNRGINDRGIGNEEESCDSQECEFENEDDYSDIEGDGDDSSEEEGEEGENQVVPWSETQQQRTPDAVSSSSTSFSSSKRHREEDDCEDACCSSKNLDSKESDGNEDFPSRALKRSRFTVPPVVAEAEPASAKSSIGTLAIVEKLRAFQQERRREFIDE